MYNLRCSIIQYYKFPSVYGEKSICIFLFIYKYDSMIIMKHWEYGTRIK